MPVSRRRMVKMFVGHVSERTKDADVKRIETEMREWLSDPLVLGIVAQHSCLAPDETGITVQHTLLVEVADAS